MSDSLARALAAPPPAAQPFGQQDMLARILMGNPDPNLPSYPVMQSAENRGFAPMPRSFADAGQRMAAVLRGDVEPTPEEGRQIATVRGFTEGPASIRAFHGSPHRFDRFDMSRIGTGEGAQAYGHGLYFAGNEGVARSYRDALSSTARNWSVNDVPLDKLHGSLDPASRLNYEIGIAARNQGGSAQDAIDFVINQKRSALTSRRTLPEDLPVLNEEIDALLRMRGAPPKIMQEPGSMYEVRLNTTPDRLLDWDAPLSAQPEVARRLGMSTRTADEIHDEAWRLMNEGGMQGKWMENPAIVQRVNSLQNELDNLPPSVTGADFYRGTDPDNFVHGMLSHGNSLPARSQQLREAGIDGIQYLDAGSRAAGDGTRNYVMFDDKLIDIMRRYGLAGLMALGASQTEFQPQSEQQ
jgi:hypothetical protein